MRGFINFYINHVPDLPENINQDFDMMVAIFKNHNKEFIKNLEETGYWVAFIPCVKEGTRVEKVEFDKPWPPVYPVPGQIKVEKEDSEDSEDDDGE